MGPDPNTNAATFITEQLSDTNQGSSGLGINQDLSNLGINDQTIIEFLRAPLYFSYDENARLKAAHLLEAIINSDKTSALDKISATDALMNVAESFAPEVRTQHMRKKPILRAPKPA